MEFAGCSLRTRHRQQRVWSGRLAGFGLISTKPLVGVPEYELEIRAETLGARSCRYGTRAVVRSSGEPRGVLVPVIFAESCDVISGTAAVHPRAMGGTGSAHARAC